MGEGGTQVVQQESGRAGGLGLGLEYGQILAACEGKDEASQGDGNVIVGGGGISRVGGLRPRA
ncbi:hypothetical protein HPP92_004225 [Vanilla planifolia]|uniref:Uncharacterized protein n=1 Tax=Vanilla planifolia TaxID=51239 RepID=A0A835RR27_VANPL|nr:hypothetical protein HPP92_004683 [Vanilla planifolia]KAG0493231.1 hypothetical protein HPP92_004225 [Vanilla planifolia]